jgi:hypothetical protein
MAQNQATSPDARTFDALGKEFTGDVVPLLQTYCLDCHSGDEPEGDLSLERFTSLAEVRTDTTVWQKVLHQLADQQMPPEDSPQPTDSENRLLHTWLRTYLATEAVAQAGDPGPVVLRRLNNAEYTYTIRDLTGVDSLDPVREFPADGAAGEGFSNVGNALGMSPALAQKYLDAAKGIAQHAVLTPDGIRFSPATTRRDWSDEILLQIRDLYARHTSGNTDVSHLDQWSRDPGSSTENDGRIDLAPYFEQLIALRQQQVSLDTTTQLLPGINRRYLQAIHNTLSSDSLSPVLKAVQVQLQAAKPGEGARIAQYVAAWQQQLFRFQPVGHLGMIQPWQAPVNPLAYNAQPVEWAWKAAERPLPAVLYITVGTATDSQIQNALLLENLSARIGATRTQIPLQQLDNVAVAMKQLQREVHANFASYLNAAFTARTREQTDIAALATEFQCDAQVLSSLLNFLGIAAESQVVIQQYLTQPLHNVAGNSNVSGWGLAGMDALSLVGNATDQLIRIPGDVGPHSIAVHPRPESQVAAGWRSPVTGTVQISSSVQHAHNSCGNGVSWRLELRQRKGRRVLAAGNAERAQPASESLFNDIAVNKGDLVALIIDARDGSHVCDLTQVDLTIKQSSPDGQQWGLATDCAANTVSSNPHPDEYGNADVWHFFTEPSNPDASPSPIPGDSVLARWLATDNPQQAAGLAQTCQQLLTAAQPAEISEADRQVVSLLSFIDGPLFSQVDLLKQATAASAPATRILPPQFYQADLSSAPATVQVPAVIPINLPQDLYQGLFSEVNITLTARPTDPAASSVSAQVAVTEQQPESLVSLQPGIPIMVQQGSDAEGQVIQAFGDFRDLFPAAMCHARIVPVDEVVTLLLYHREDDYLSRLMLDEQERQRLDRLWNELFFVSQDALRLETALEQILEFATQDADPSRFDPVLEPIAENTRRFHQQSRDAEPHHVHSVIALAATAWRRPMTDSEGQQLEALYQKLRTQHVDHDEAIRLLIARVLTSPAFLYRLETSQAGTQSHSITDHELASRLSYFLWSSMPDEQLLQLADSGQLSDPQQLVRQSQRLLDSQKTRRLAVEFAAQWLHIRDFDELDEKSLRHFPEFTELRSDMYEESLLFFEDLFRNDRSVMNIFDADYVFVNGRLAQMYGIPNVTGDQWQRIDGARAYSRGGILTMATTLAKQSGASRTSPILRGNWISESLLGERLPRPPKDVPTLPEDVPAGLTSRQLIEQHSSVAECARCHKRIDPYGFALENFDAIGRHRPTYKEGQPVDAASVLPDGTPINGLDDLRTYLTTQRKDVILRVFCRKLLGYALGRAVQLSDEPLLDEMMQQLQQNDYRFSVAVRTIVLSDQFRKVRGQDYSQL